MSENTQTQPDNGAGFDPTAAYINVRNHVVVTKNDYMVNIRLFEPDATEEIWRPYSSRRLMSSLSEGYDTKWASHVLNKLQSDPQAFHLPDHHVVDSLPLYPAGRHYIGDVGSRGGDPTNLWLCRHSRAPIVPVPGDPLPIIRVIVRLFRSEAPIFLGWLRGALRRQLRFAHELRHEEHNIPPLASQTLCLVGSPGTGKTKILLDIIIQSVLGKYEAMPSAFLTGESRFNEWAIRASIWVSDDSTSFKGNADRKKAATKTKEYGYASKFLVEAKGKDAASFTFPNERIFIVNDSESALSALPDPEENEDKFLFLLISGNAGIMADFKGDTQAMDDALSRSAPAFAHWLLNSYQIPDWYTRQSVGDSHRHEVMDPGYVSPKIDFMLTNIGHHGLVMKVLKQYYMACNQNRYSRPSSHLLDQTRTADEIYCILTNDFPELKDLSPQMFRNALRKCNTLYPGLVEYKRTNEKRYYTIKNSQAWFDEHTDGQLLDAPPPLDASLLNAAGLSAEDLQS